VLSYAGSGYLLKTVVKLAAKPVSVIDGALPTADANSIGTLGGGIVGTAGMTYLWLRRRGVNAGAAGLGGWLPIFLNNATLAVVSLGGRITGFITKIRHKAENRPAAEAAVARLLDGWDALLQGGWRGPALGAVLNTGFDMLTLAFLFLAAGHGVTIAVLVAGYGVPQLLGKLTVILGGIGVVEVGMIGLYDTLGVPRPTAVVVVLAYLLLSFWLPTLIGVALATYFEHSTATADEAVNHTED